MNGDDRNNTVMHGFDQQNGSQFSHPSVRDYAMLEELHFVRREAQAEAYVAYEDWRQHPRSDRYAVYLAAQDRADAAQDELAKCASQLAV